MKISVTQSHIDKGKQGQCSNCPVALAMNEVMDKVAVAYNYFLIGDGPRIALPAIVQTFILDFDCGRHVEPFEFEINYYVC